MMNINKSFPLLNEIDQQINADNIEWNKNAFETLLTSNLPTKTIFYYAIDVGLRQLENSLYESSWDTTIDALNDIAQYLFTLPFNDDYESYLYEAKCQFLIYAAISVIKMHTIRGRSINEAKMFCGTISLLLLEQSKSYETSSGNTEYSSCIRSMRFRYLKRMFIIGQWLPTLSNSQLKDIETYYEQYIETMINSLFTGVSLRDKINRFIDNCLFNNTNEDLLENDEGANGFVFIRRFPKFNEKTIDKYSGLMYMGFVNTLNQLQNNNNRKLICSLWTICCMIETNRISFNVLNNCVIRKRFSMLPIDFEQKPILFESLNESDIIIFLLLCAQQNTHEINEDSILSPYLLYSSSNLCTQNQTVWWHTAIEQTSLTPDFIDHVATIRLDDERLDQHPPILILLRTAKILFRLAQTAYEQCSQHSSSSYEQYAIQYFQTAKAQLRKLKSRNSNANEIPRQKTLFFSYSRIIINGNYMKLVEESIQDCERFARQCDELKLLPDSEPDLLRVSWFSNDDFDYFHSTSLSSSLVQKEEKYSTSEPFSLISTSSPISTAQISPSNIPSVEEIEETSTTPKPPIVGTIFSHIESVNQWMNKFYSHNEGIQNDINTLRDQLEQLNRATSQLIFANTQMSESESSENSDHLNSPHS